MYNHNKAQQSKNRVHISWDILYVFLWRQLIKDLLLNSLMRSLWCFNYVKKKSNDEEHSDMEIDYYSDVRLLAEKTNIQNEILSTGWHLIYKWIMNIYIYYNVKSGIVLVCKC